MEASKKQFMHLNDNQQAEKRRGQQHRDMMEKLEELREELSRKVR
jgi:hypothetical protein